MVSTWESGSVARTIALSHRGRADLRVVLAEPDVDRGLHGGEVRVVGREAAYGDRALPHDRLAIEDEQRVVPDLDPGGHRGGPQGRRGVVHPLDRLR